jgi:DNA polymerase-3 subunit epsilon
VAFALFSLDYRRRRLARRAPEGPMRAFLQTPFPATTEDAREVEYVALDLETTGLDPQSDEILSFGWVRTRGPLIDLRTAQHRVVRPSQAIPEQSAVIHGITDDAAAEGESLEAPLADLLSDLSGRVMIAHHARIELGFLQVACWKLFGAKFVVATVDTLALALRAMERSNQSYRSGDMRLDALRTRYNLPRYRAHDALVDALAAAELFAAMLAERDNGRRLPLRQFLVER